MADESAGQYTISLGVDASSFNRGVKQATDSLSSFAAGLKGMAAGMVGGKFMQSLTAGFMDIHTNLSNITSVSGYNITEVTALGNVLEHLGGNVNGVVSTLNGLTSALESAKWGAGALVEVSKKYGITFQKSNGELMNSEQLLMSLHQQMQRYDKTTRYAIASQLGLDEALQRAFLMTPKALREQIELKKKYNKVSERDAELASSLETSLLDLKHSWAGLSKELSYVVIPVFVKFLEAAKYVLQVFRESKLIVPGFFVGMSFGFLKVLSYLRNILSVTKNVGSAGGVINKTLLAGVGIFGKFNGALKTTFGLIKKIGMASFMNPIGIIIGVILIAIIAVGLAINEIVGYCLGWDNTISKLEERFPTINKFLNIMKAICRVIADIFSEIAGYVKPITTGLGYVWDYTGGAVIAGYKRIANKDFKSAENTYTDEDYERELGIDPHTGMPVALPSNVNNFHSTLNSPNPPVSAGEVTVNVNTTINANAVNPDAVASAINNRVAHELKKLR